MGLADDKKERIASEDPATKTNSAIVSEVRGILRRNLPQLFSQNDEELTVEVTNEPFIDDFMNVMEIACSVRGKGNSSPE